MRLARWAGQASARQKLERAWVILGLAPCPQRPQFSCLNYLKKKNRSCFIDLSANFNLHSGVKCHMTFMHLAELLHRYIKKEKKTILYQDFVSNL